MTTKDCLFCKIVKGEIKSDFLYESKLVVAFNDINPVAGTHILIIPKKHIDSVFTIESGDSGELVEMYKAAVEIAKEKKLDAFRLSFNAGKFQHVPHLHMHFLAGSKIEWSRL